MNKKGVTTRVKGRPTIYPLDKWLDGKHKSIRVSKFANSWQAIRESIRRRANKLGVCVTISRTSDPDILQLRFKEDICGTTSDRRRS